MRVYILPAFKRIFSKRETKAIEWTRQVNFQIKALEKAGESVKWIHPIRNDYGDALYWVFHVEKAGED